MKRSLSALAATAGLLLGVLVYERLFVEKTLGPAVIASVSVLVGLFLSLVITVLLYDTRHQAVAGKLWLVPWIRDF